MHLIFNVKVFITDVARICSLSRLTDSMSWFLILYWPVTSIVFSYPNVAGHEYIRVSVSVRRWPS